MTDHTHPTPDPSSRPDPALEPGGAEKGSTANVENQGVEIPREPSTERQTCCECYQPCAPVESFSPATRPDARYHRCESCTDARAAYLPPDPDPTCYGCGRQVVRSRTPEGGFACGEGGTCGAEPDLQGACIYCGSADATGHEDGGCPTQAAYLADQEEADLRAGSSPVPGGILDTSRRIATGADWPRVHPDACGCPDCIGLARAEASRAESDAYWRALNAADSPIPACECSEEYGPCESHGEVLCQREGASLHTADESALLLCADLIDCGAELSATGKLDLALLTGALDRARDPVSGCAWFDREEDSSAARDLADQLEAYVADLWVIHDDGYRIVRPSEDCPLLAD